MGSSPGMEQDQIEQTSWFQTTSTTSFARSGLPCSGSVTREYAAYSLLETLRSPKMKKRAWKKGPVQIH